MNRSRSHHGDPSRKHQPTLLEIKEQLNLIQRMIERSYQGIMTSVDELGEIVMSELSDALDFAEQTAAEDASADNSAKALLITLSDMVKALGNGVNDPALVARIKALGDGIRARAADLSAAVVANTPAATPPTGGSMGGVTE